MIRGWRWVSLLSIIALALGLLPSLAAARPAPLPLSFGYIGTSQRVCNNPGPGEAACIARLRTDSAARNARPSRGTSVKPDVLGNGGAYDPSYLQSAYNLAGLSQSAGSGETVAIVDAYNDPDVASNLSSYRSYFGLSACTTSNGCFRVVNQTGGTTLPSNNTGWAQEISLDVDMVSAICPNCNILLVEANDASFTNLLTAVDTAVRSGAKYVSMSWGGSDFNGETSYDSHFNKPGIAFTAAAGDNGYGASYPATSSYVTAVGGTSLNQTTNSGGRNASETVWSGTGSGCSAYEPQPSWQSGTGSACGAHRTDNDVSAVADPNTGVWVYDTDGEGGWLIFGGTSVATPIIASVYALAGQPGASSLPASYPYANPSALNDVTSGSNGSCGGTYLCTGEVGYDGPTGLGTPNGVGAFQTSGTPVGSAPSISNLTPASGPTGGGTTVTINGANFSGASAVSFGSTSGTIQTVTSSQITVTSPSHAAGTVDVTVATTAGTSATSAADRFSFTPTVTGISPTSGSASTTVTVNGSGFTGASAVTFGSTPASSFSVVNDGQIKAVAPAGSGTVDVKVTNGGVTSPTSSADQFSYTAGAQSFTLSATPSSRSIRRYRSTSYTVSVSAVNGFSSSVSLSVSGLPSGVSASFSSNPISPGVSSTLRVQSGNTTGTFTLTITGSGGGVTQRTTVSLTITR